MSSAAGRNVARHWSKGGYERGVQPMHGHHSFKERRIHFWFGDWKQLFVLRGQDAVFSVRLAVTRRIELGALGVVPSQG